MIRRLSLLILLIAAHFNLHAVSAQTAYPMLMDLSPVAAEVGQTSEHTIHSRHDMSGAYQIVVTGEGVTAEVVLPEVKAEEKDKEKAKDKAKAKKKDLVELKVRFTVAADAKLGVRDFRLATPQGASTLGQVVIVRDPVVQESGDNSAAEKATAVTLPATICGTIEKAEDVDFYKFPVKAGASWSFHVRSNRLQNRIHDLQQHSDPILTLRAASGTTVAASDNHFYGDPFIHHRFEQDGEYLLEIRDVRYQGNKYWQYSIEVSDRAFVSNVYPLAVAPGQEVELEMVGVQLPENPMTRLAVPMELPPGPHRLPLAIGDGETNPVPLVVSDSPLVLEAKGDNNLAAGAAMVTVPGGINGRIDVEADVDCFAFEAKKGERYSFEVVARRQQSNLDPHLRILNAEGKQLQLNDDMRIDKRNYADSLIENWTVPADGKYVMEIRDLHLRGGAEFVYFIQVTRSEPFIQLFADTDKTLLTPGTNGVLFVRVKRKNGFEGEVALNIEGLPQGVTAVCGRILAKRDDGCIVLRAAGDAPMAMANVTITGTSTHQPAEGEAITVTATARPYQETYMPGGGRGHYPVELHSVSVGAASDIRKVTLSAMEVSLKPGESQKIDITIERAEGFEKNVTLDVLYKHLSSVYGDPLPKGVTLDAGNSKTLLTGKETQGHITLKAAADVTPTDHQQICIMANVSLNFVMKATYASEPVLLSVEAVEKK